MSAGQESGSPIRENRTLLPAPLPPDEARGTLAAAAGVSTVGLRPPFDSPAAAFSSRLSRRSHLDCRARRLIAEPLCVRLGIDRTSARAVTSGNNVAALAPRATSLPPEAKRIVDALRAICALPEDTIVMWCGRPHKFVRPHHANPTKGTQLIGRPGAERAAQIVLAPDDERKKNQHIFTKFAVVPNGKPAPGKPPFFLECEGNPTTLMTGNNVLPVTSRNAKTKALERYPSSKHNVMTAVNRLLFRFLEDIAAQVTGSDIGLFEPATFQ